MTAAPSAPDLDAVAAAYGRWAEAYIDLVGSAERAPERDRATIAAWAADLRGPVLDAGSGPGHWSGFLHDRGIEVAGVDATPEFVEHARRTHPAVRFELGDLRELESDPGALGGILAWFSLIHLDPALVPGVLDRFVRALHPDGTLLVGFFSADRIGPFDHRVVTATAWPVVAMTRALETAGFAVVATDEWETPNGRRNAAVRARPRG